MTTAAGVSGPIDFVLLEFSADKVTGEAAAALFELVEQGIIRIYDLLVIRKDADGSISGVDITDLTNSSLGGFVTFAGARSGLLSDDDLADAGGAMRPGTIAALIVYENTWAVPFIAAARAADGQLIASARIPADVVMDVLDALDAADAAN